MPTRYPTSCNGLALILVKRPQTNPGWPGLLGREHAAAGRAQARHPALLAAVKFRFNL
jgi:hypothetical protein